jgi:hypothetical protein
MHEHQLRFCFFFWRGVCFFGSVVCLQMTLGKECMTNGSGFFYWAGSEMKL